jgi:hypothetical protein
MHYFYDLNVLFLILIVVHTSFLKKHFSKKNYAIELAIMIFFQRKTI